MAAHRAGHSDGPPRPRGHDPGTGSRDRFLDLQALRRRGAPARGSASHRRSGLLVCQPPGFRLGSLAGRGRGGGLSGAAAGPGTPFCGGLTSFRRGYPSRDKLSSRAGTRSGASGVHGPMSSSETRREAMNSFEKVFARICLEHGWAGRSQIADAVRARSENPGGTATLAALLIARGVLTEEQAATLQSEASDVTRSGAYAGVRDEDTWLGKLLVESGAVAA